MSTTRLDLTGASLPPPATPHDAWATASGSPLDRLSTVLRRRAIAHHDETCTGIDLGDGAVMALRLAPVRYTEWRALVANGGGDEYKTAVAFLVAACKAIVVAGEVYMHPSGHPMKLTDKAFHEALSNALGEPVKSPADALRLMFLGGDWEVVSVSNQHVARSQGLLEAVATEEGKPSDPFEETTDSEQ